VTVPGGSSDRRAVLQQITAAQRLGDQLVALVPADDRDRAWQLRDQAVDTLDWTKGLVDPLHAEEYTPAGSQ
jgi:hypothetical protein